MITPPHFDHSQFFPCPHVPYLLTFLPSYIRIPYDSALHPLTFIFYSLSFLHNIQALTYNILLYVRPSDFFIELMQILKFGKKRANLGGKMLSHK